MIPRLLFLIPSSLIVGGVLWLELGGAAERLVRERLRALRGCRPPCPDWTHRRAGF